VIYNWNGLTNGSDGIPGIPSPRLFGIEFDSIPSYFTFSGIIALICAGLLYLIGNSPFGRALKAIREDEIAAASLGKNIIRFKIVAFAMAAGFAAIPGVLFAGYMHYIEPTSFTFMESIFIVSIIIIGGTGNISGPIIGTILMVVLPEALRFLGMPDSIAPNMRQIIYGGLIILIMRYRPQGLLGEYRLE
jgi:branched-chain amino acid transport system permease protein